MLRKGEPKDQQIHTGHGKALTGDEAQEYVSAVYALLFYTNKKWEHQGPTQYFEGTLIHYADFMKAKRGSLSTR